MTELDASGALTPRGDADVEAASGADGALGAPPGAARRQTVWADVRIYLGAVVVALVVNAVLLLAIGADPLVAYRQILSSSLGSVAALAQTLNRMTPLLLGSAAVAFAMRAGYVNLGVDGQIYGGAILATGTAFALYGLPAAVVLPAVLVAAILGGGTVALLPAVLRARRGVNELFTTVMLNFVAFYAADYLSTGPWTDPVAGEAISVPIGAEARLPGFLTGGGHIGILLALPLVVAMAWWLRRTRAGFEFRAVGGNPRAAQFGGVSLVATGVVALVVSGLVAGLAGGIEVTGVHRRLILGLTPNFGYMAVLIAVLARRSPLGAIPAAFGFAVLIVGSDSLQRSVGLPASAGFLFQAVVVLAVLYFEVRRGGVLAAVRGRVGR